MNYAITVEGPHGTACVEFDAHADATDELFGDVRPSIDFEPDAHAVLAQVGIESPDWCDLEERALQEWEDNR